MPKPALHEIHVYPEHKGRTGTFGSKWWNGKDWKGGCGDARCSVGAAHGAIVTALSNWRNSASNRNRVAAPAIRPQSEQLAPDSEGPQVQALREGCGEEASSDRNVGDAGREERANVASGTYANQSLFPDHDVLG